MPTDVFNREIQIGQPFSADAASLIMAGVEDELIVRTLDVTYQQQINRVWSIDEPKTYFVAGRPQGTLTLGKVIGPIGLNRQLFDNYGDVCNVASNVLTFMLGSSCGAVAGNLVTVVCTGCVITSWGLRVASEDMIINENVQIMFARLNLAS